MSNLLEILAACERDQPDVAALRFAQLRRAEGGADQTIVDTLAPIQRRYAELRADRGYLDQVRRDGAERARDRAAGRHRAKQARPPSTPDQDWPL